VPPGPDERADHLGEDAVELRLEADLVARFDADGEHSARSAQRRYRRRNSSGSGT
jgi:hypothetical protein